jgi:hypothetical protein
MHPLSQCLYAFINTIWRFVVIIAISLIYGKEMAQATPQSQPHAGVNGIISMSGTRISKTKHPKQPINLRYQHPNVQALFSNLNKDHVTFKIEESWGNFSADITEPISFDTFNTKTNPGYSVMGCYIIWQVPIVEMSNFKLNFQNEKIMELLLQHACYIGESSATKPSDRIGGRVNSLKRSFEKHLSNLTSPLRANAKEASAYELVKNMMTNYNAYLKANDPYKNMTKCLFASYIDVKTMLGPNGEQLTPKWVERTLIDLCRNNGKLVNQN